MISKKALVEGVLFASPQPINPTVIASVLECEVTEVEALIEQITSEYNSDDKGFELRKIAGGYQFRTKADLKTVMAKFYESRPPRLTQATLEVLAIVAYKQPVTRPEIDKIRGVDSSAVVKALLERELIEMQGRSQLPGLPVLYGTTSKFLEWFQIPHLSELPPLSEIEALNVKTDEGVENLMDLLNRDDEFMPEELSEMDKALNAAQRENRQFEQIDLEASAESKALTPKSDDTLEFEISDGASIVPPEGERADLSPVVE